MWYFHIVRTDVEKENSHGTTNDIGIILIIIIVFCCCCNFC